ncbi:MAG TPA: hypothetical protein VF380_09280 [Solirubrobacteraceae bacterium]
MIAIIVLALLGLVVLVVGAPLRAARRPREPGGEDADGLRGGPDAPGAQDLQAERDAKYQEIRDAELDYRTGKLSPEDYALIDADLRAEAIEILNRVEEHERRERGDLPEL